MDRVSGMQKDLNKVKIEHHKFMSNTMFKGVRVENIHSIANYIHIL